MSNKILFITGPLNGGGAERVLLDILHHIDYDRYDVTLAQIVPGGSLDHEIPSSVKRISLWTSYDLHYKLSLRLSAMFGIHHFLRYRINAKLSHINFDSVISFLEGMPLKLHGLLDMPNARHISWVHIDLYKFPYESSIFYNEDEEIVCYEKMDAIQNVSLDCLNGFVNRFPALKNLSTYIHNPIDINSIISKSKESFQITPNFTVITVGRLTEQKRIDRVVRIAKLCKDSSIAIKFLIVGSGDEKNKITSLIEDWDLFDYITIIPFIDNPYKIIKNSQVLLSTSEAEGFGLVHCEAMALGVPVISTKTSGPVEIIGDDQYGLLVEHDDESIFEGVMKLYSDENLRRHYQNMGRKRAKDFDISQFMDKFYNLLK